jgi:hypothetical protein
MRRVLIGGLVVAAIAQMSVLLVIANRFRVDGSGGPPTPHSAIDQALLNTPRARAQTNLVVTTCGDLALYAPFQVVLALGVRRLRQRGHGTTVALVVVGTFLALFSLLAVDQYSIRQSFGDAIPYIHSLTGVMCLLSLAPVAFSLRTSPKFIV